MLYSVNVNTDSVRLDGQRIVYYVPQTPLSFVLGGAEFHAQRTMEAMRLLGVDARWLPVGDADALREGDVVHFFGCPGMATGWTATIPRGILDVVSPIFYETDVAHRALWPLARRLRGSRHRRVASLAQRAHVLIVYSHAEAVQMQQLWGVAAERVHVVTIGCDASPGDAEYFWDVLNPGLDPSRPFVLSVGRWEPRKRTVETVQAAIEAGTQLLLIGRPAPWALPSYIERIRGVVDASHGRILSIPWVEHDQVCHCYAAAHTHVLASVVETPGLASLEADAGGCNLVVGESPPVREYFADLAEYASGSVVSIQNAILRTLDQPRDSHGQSRIIAESFTWRKSAIATLRAYGWETVD
jgi:glycosyltransferase involved in cell wall biosynthesis